MEDKPYKPRKVIQTTLKGSHIATWESAKSLADEYGVSDVAIYYAVKNARPFRGTRLVFGEKRNASLVKECISCGKSFEKKPQKSRAAWKQTKYCSRVCLNKKDSRVDLACRVCRKAFKRHPSHVADERRVYCSKQCLGKSKWIMSGGAIHNPEYFRLQCQKRRAMLIGVGNTLTSKEWSSLKEKYDYRCLSCKKREPSVRLTIDHIIPISRGGANALDNIQPLCGSCNSRKSVRSTDFRSLYTT